jgi:hypothetical protein
MGSKIPLNIRDYVGFEVFTAVVMESIIFWDVTPCSDVSEEHIASILRVEEIISARTSTPAYFLVLAEIISSTLEMDAIYSSETSVATQQTTRRHIPEVDTLHT